MAVFERSALVEASLDDVWAFHLTPDSLVAVTPDWLHLRIERIAGPDGRTDEFEEGTEIRLSVRPFGAGPRYAWTSRIVDRSCEGNRAFFRDRMVSGPLPRWEHTHRFVADGDGTRIVDRVEYELPLGPLRGASGVARPAMAAVFAHRHRRTRARLER